MYKCLNEKRRPYRIAIGGVTVRTATSYRMGIKFAKQLLDEFGETTAHIWHPRYEGPETGITIERNNR